MDAPPIPFSTTDLERQRLESTLDNDLSSLSLTVSNSAPSTSFSSSSSVSTLGVARSAPAVQYRAPDDTLRPGRNPSFAASFASAGVGASPASTAGHHVSAATLGAGVFRRPGAGGNGAERTADEFDPDRSLGRLVGELAKAMGEDRMNKPASPFHRPHSPRSPSPAPASLPNLSFSFNRNDPLPSPPQSRTVSAASSKSTGSRGSGNNKGAQNAPARSPLGETTRHNLYVPTHLPIPSVGKKPGRVPGLGAPGRRADVTADLTGMTGITQLLDTPAKGIQFDSIDKNAAPETAGQNIPSALSSLHAHIRALQNENGVANHRIRELEAECARARDEIVDMQRNSDRRLNEVESEKRALEELVESLRAHLARVTAELESHKAILAELRRARDGDTSVRDDLAGVKREVARLSREVARLNEVAEKGLLARSHAREQRSVRIAALDLADEELDRVRRDVQQRANVLRDTNSAATQTDYAAAALPSQLRQGLHAAAAREAGLMPPSAKPVTRVSSDSEGERDAEVGPHSPTPASRRSSSRASRHSPVQPVPVPEPEARLARCAASERAERELRKGRDPAPPAADITPSHHSIASSTASRRRRRAEGPASPFPSIRAEDEEEFFSPRPSPRARPHHRATPSRSRPTTAATAEPRQRTGPAPAPMSVRAILEGTGGAVPPVTVLSRVIAELEADFAHYKSIYVELADQYKVLDAASAVTKRHVLAEHLKEVIDCLEQKADQIAALYSTMHVSDRPTSPAAASSTTHKSVQELWRCVRDALGEDAVRRLRADGLFRQ